MDKQYPSIEFRKMPFPPDPEDLSQECTAYMKTKQFMAKRIHQQQEEIEMLKQNLIFHSGKHMQLLEVVNDMKDQIELLKESIKLNTKDINKDLNLSNSNSNSCSNSNEELVSSFIYEDGEVAGDNFENIQIPKVIEVKAHNVDENVKIDTHLKEENKVLKKENIQLRKALEKSGMGILERTIELNKTKTDKFVLYNELNELVMSLKKVDLKKLNSFYKKNTSDVLNKFEMPLAKGIKFNILSAQSQLCKLLIRDSNYSNSINKKNDSDKNVNINANANDSLQLESYLNVLKKTEEEFETLLDRKLAKRSKSFFK